MSNRTVLIWLCIAIGLGGAALLLLRDKRGGGGPAEPVHVRQAGAPLFAVPPAAQELRSIVVGEPSGAVSRLERDDAGRWWLRLDDPRTGTGRTWSVESGHISAVARMLADARIAAVPTAGARLPESAATVTLRTVDREWMLRLADRSLAGTGLVGVSTRPLAAGDDQNTTAVAAGSPVLVDDRLHKAFREPGPKGWRSRGVFTAPMTDEANAQAEKGDSASSRLNAVRSARTITLRNATAMLTFSRVGSRWALVEPVIAPASDEAIARLLTTLESVQITDFLDDQPGAGAVSASSLVASVIVEHNAGLPADDHSGEPVRPSALSRRVLEIGEPAPTSSGNAPGQHVRAVINGRAVTIDARPLAEITPTPGRFIRAYASDTRASDVGTLVLSPLASTPADQPAGVAASGSAGWIFRRSLARWKEISQSGAERELTPDEVSRTERVLGFLTGDGQAVPAERIDIVKPVEYAAVARINLLSLGDAPLEEIELGFIRSTGPGLPTAVLRSGSVYRMYALGSLPPQLSVLLPTER